MSCSTLGSGFCERLEEAEVLVKNAVRPSVRR